MNFNHHTLSRRTFLRGAGAVIALPLLEAMNSSVAKADGDKKIPRRFVAIETNMGILPQFFFPEKAGADYAATPYLQKLAAHRKNMTVFSGVSLPGVTGGHSAEKCFLTGTPHPERGGFRNGVSLDQFAAEQIGNATRYPSLGAPDECGKYDAKLHAQWRAYSSRTQPAQTISETIHSG